MSVSFSFGSGMATDSTKPHPLLRCSIARRPQKRHLPNSSAFAGGFPRKTVAALPRPAFAAPAWVCASKGCAAAIGLDRLATARLQQKLPSQYGRSSLKWKRQSGPHRGHNRTLTRRALLASGIAAMALPRIAFAAGETIHSEAARQEIDHASQCSPRRDWSAKQTLQFSP